MKGTLEILDNSKNDLMVMMETAEKLNLIIDRYVNNEFVESEPELKEMMLRIHDETESHIDDLAVAIKYISKSMDEIKNNPDLSLYEEKDYVTLSKLLLIGVNESKINFNKNLDQFREKLNSNK